VCVCVCVKERKRQRACVCSPVILAAVRVHSTSTCVQPSLRALATGTGSNTAASTQRCPLTSLGGPATSGMVAEAARQSSRSCSLWKLSKVMGRSRSSEEATTCGCVWFGR
jgi:hypothetical protein